MFLPALIKLPSLTWPHLPTHVHDRTVGLVVLTTNLVVMWCLYSHSRLFQLTHVALKRWDLCKKEYTSIIRILLAFKWSCQIIYQIGPLSGYGQNQTTINSLNGSDLCVLYSSGCCQLSGQVMHLLVWSYGYKWPNCTTITSPSVLGPYLLVHLKLKCGCPTLPLMWWS